MNRIDVDAGRVERGDCERRPAQTGRRTQIAPETHPPLGMSAVQED